MHEYKLTLKLANLCMHVYFDCEYFARQVWNMDAAQMLLWYTSIDDEHVNSALASLKRGSSGDTKGDTTHGSYVSSSSSYHKTHFIVPFQDN